MDESRGTTESGGNNEQTSEAVEHQEPLKANEGIAALEAALSEAAGAELTDFFRSRKGQEFLKTKKIVIAGAPQSGKSVLRELLKRAIRHIPGAPYPYFLTAAPDGEWAGFQESVRHDPDMARQMKTDYKDAIKKGGAMFTPAYVERIRQSVHNLSSPHSPLNFLDIGGKQSVENHAICEGANAAILLCGEKAARVGIGQGNPEDSQKPEMDPKQWQKFFASMGIPIIAAIYSDYLGKEDVGGGVGENGIFIGSSHYFERGELDYESRPTVRKLAEYLTSGAVERELYMRAAVANLNVMRRTSKGVVDASASVEKASQMMGVEGIEAADRATANFSGVIERLYEDRAREFKDAAELRSFVESVASQVNEGITKEDVLIRQADSEKFPYTRVADLPQAMDNFYQEFFERLNTENIDPIELAAWVEWRINIIDHFFADGCGRISMAISAWLLMRNNHILPTYCGRKEYYANAPDTVRGINEQKDREYYQHWLEYYRSLFDLDTEIENPEK